MAAEPIFEVTVPVTVTVQQQGDKYVVTQVDYDLWGGFFSEAEDAEGVWVKDQIIDGEVWEGEWGHDDQDEIYQAARDFVAGKATL
jgi:hypothetical protein